MLGFAVELLVTAAARVAREAGCVGEVSVRDVGQSGTVVDFGVVCTAVVAAGEVGFVQAHLAGRAQEQVGVLAVDLADAGVVGAVLAVLDASFHSVAVFLNSM